VRGAPRNAAVYIGEVALTGDPPSALIWPAAEVELAVDARGYQPYREKIAVEQDGEFNVHLQRLGEVTPGPRDAGRVHNIPSVPDEPF